MKLSKLNSFIMKLGIELHLGENFMEGYTIVKNMPFIELKKLVENKE